MVTPDKRHCGLMDNLTPITTSAFDTINAELCQVSKSVTEYSMKSTMKNEIEPTATEYQGLTVFGDGFWIKSGFN
uniref:Uncharacterized protein n=1 Tax=Trichogramma kaykai TaxID=54128 RepID=A0ABD2WR19_9HYME